MNTPPQRRRILCTCTPHPGTTSSYRLRSLRRLGQDVIVFDTTLYQPTSRYLSHLAARAPVGPLIHRINRDLLRMVREYKPDIVFFDRPTQFTRSTILADGASATLSNPSLHSVLMELNGSGNRYGFDEDLILRKMKDYGFSTYAYDPFPRELRRLPGRNITGNNTLFLRNENSIRERISCAPPVLVHTQKF